MSTLLTSEVRSILERGRYSKDYTDIPNGHKALEGLRETLEGIATLLGIDFEETAYTFTVKRGNDPQVFQPSIVQSAEGSAVIRWGTVEKPLADLKDLSMAINDYEGRFYLEIDLDDETSIEFVINVSKDESYKPLHDVKALRAALKKGNLGGLLAKVGTRLVKLSEVEPGSYTVIGYRADVAFGKEGFILNVEGLGQLKANTRLIKILDNKPVITKDVPATLHVEESTETTAQGFPIIPVRLETQAALALPVFDF